MAGVTIAVQDASGGARFPAEDRLRTWVLAAVTGPQAGEPASPAAGEVLIRIVGTQESAQLNARYRGKRGPTNVLAFLSDLPETPSAQSANAIADGAGDGRGSAGSSASPAPAEPAEAAAAQGEASPRVLTLPSRDAPASDAPPAGGAAASDGLPLGDLVICAPVVVARGARATQVVRSALGTHRRPRGSAPARFRPRDRGAGPDDGGSRAQDPRKSRFSRPLCVARLMSCKRPRRSST